MPHVGLFEFGADFFLTHEVKMVHRWRPAHLRNVLNPDGIPMYNMIPDSIW